MRKIKDVIIYDDAHYYSAFPSIVQMPDGELIVAFRRAPDRRPFGGGTRHSDPNSYLVLVRSFDNGETWTEEPELICAHPLGGSQDPCMTLLKGGTILCSSYLWCLLDKPSKQWEFTFLGGYLMRSSDGGHTWEGPILPPSVPDNKAKDVLGRPLPASNRGAMIEASDGVLYWVVIRHDRGDRNLSSIHLMASADRGTTWEYRCPVAVDGQVTFNETSLTETEMGDLVAFVRTANFDDHTVIVRSRNGGRSFEPWEDAGFQGHPHDARRLPDGRVYLVYGYRHEPFGIRARVLNRDCTNASQAEEIILRDDGGTRDLGYPWSSVLPDGRVLTVYYFNKEDGTRHIAGTFLEM